MGFSIDYGQKPGSKPVEERPRRDEVVRLLDRAREGLAESERDLLQLRQMVTAAGMTGAEALPDQDASRLKDRAYKLGLLVAYLGDLRKRVQLHDGWRE